MLSTLFKGDMTKGLYINQSPRKIIRLFGMLLSYSEIYAFRVARVDYFYQS